MEKADISVIVVTLQNNPDEIDSICRLHELDSDFELIIRNDEGISKARNNGIDSASNDKIIFLDDDAVPEPGYIEAASKALDKHPVVVGAVQSPDKNVFDELAVHYRDPNKLVGCNMGFQRKVFEEVGYFDQDFHWGHEETELQNRITTRYALYYEPDMLVTHAYADSFTDYANKMWKLGKVDIDYWIKTKPWTSMCRSKSQSKHVDHSWISKSLKGRMYESIGRIIRIISMAVGLPQRLFVKISFLSFNQ